MNRRINHNVDIDNLETLYVDPGYRTISNPSSEVFKLNDMLIKIMCWVLEGYTRWINST